MRRMSPGLLLIAVAGYLTTFTAAAQVNWNEPSVTVDGKSGWKKTAYRATEGKEFTAIARGRVRHSWMSGWHGPEGNPSPFCKSCRITTRCNVAALIMKVGRDGKVYCVEKRIPEKRLVRARSILPSMIIH